MRETDRKKEREREGSNKESSTQNHLRISAIQFYATHAKKHSFLSGNIGQIDISADNCI